tara:strand:+ start:2609 stop:2914 length:306 start_codon:yes stop_codon:yes gene_type:complete
MDITLEKIKCYGCLLSLRVDVEDKIDKLKEDLTKERLDKLKKTVDSLNHVMFVMNEVFHMAELTNLESSRSERTSLELMLDNRTLKQENELMRQQIKEWIL